MNRHIPTMILVIAAFALPARTASAHPSSGIVVSPDGNLYYGHALLDGGKVAVGLTRISPDGLQTRFSPDLKRTLEKRDDAVVGLATGPNGSVYVSTWATG